VAWSVLLGVGWGLMVMVEVLPAVIWVGMVVGKMVV